MEVHMSWGSGIRGVFLLVAGVAIGVSIPAMMPAPPEPRQVDASEGESIESPQRAQASEARHLGADESETIEVFRNASESVVSIQTLALRRNMFSFDVMQIPAGAGSGFVWDRKGHIVTNFHVIEEGNAFQVTLADQSAWEAQVVGTAPYKDLAVLRIDAPADRLVPLPLGSSSDLVVGQKVLALGNPFGLDQTLTVGVLSALGRELSSFGGRTIHDVLQTDAAINPGNSGGPLLDSSGKLIGVNTAIYTPSGYSVGVGFSIPVDTIAVLVPQLILHRHPIQPGIGIELFPRHIEEAFRQRLGIVGVPVGSVREGGPAERAGIVGATRDRYGSYRLGDVIVSVDGKTVESSAELFDVFEEKGVGARVALILESDGKRREVDVTLIAVN
jgi:S1-C subfamily serine protease